MKITIAAVGKAKQSPERTLYEHYSARIAWPVTVKELDDKKLSGKSQQASALLQATALCDVRIALDEKGESLTSHEFAKFLDHCRIRSAPHIAFLIGGADGLDASIFPHCRLRLNLGSLTWPHMLVRGLLAEQLYRAQTILSGHPYHRD